MSKQVGLAQNLRRRPTEQDRKSVGSPQKHTNRKLVSSAKLGVNVQSEHGAVKSYERSMTNSGHFTAGLSVNIVKQVDNFIFDYYKKPEILSTTGHSLEFVPIEGGKRHQKDTQFEFFKETRIL